MSTRTITHSALKVAKWEANGRAADIFSLGCVLLEILVLHYDGTLQRLRKNWSTKGPASHADLTNLDAWLPWTDNLSPRTYHLFREVRAMLSSEPGKRPLIDNLLSRVSLCDRMMTGHEYSIFGDCCRTSYITASQHDQSVAKKDHEIRRLKSSLLQQEAANTLSISHLVIANNKAQERDEEISRLKAENDDILEQGRSWKQNYILRCQQLESDQQLNWINLNCRILNCATFNCRMSVFMRRENTSKSSQTCKPRR